MKGNNNSIVNELVKNVREMKGFNREQIEINLGHKEIHHEFARAMIETNRRQEAMGQRMEAMGQRMDRFMNESERRFRMFYDRLVKIEHRH